MEKVNFGDVMVVGGGISGIQASLDLAESGFKVYLVEKLPGIGGHMAQFDKTFPTNDCSLCIESPKLVECYRHPNIEIITCAEIESIEGELGDFEVTLIKYPRYISEDKCVGCTTCTEFCPLLIPDPYNENLSNCKVAHIYFPQTVPLLSYIDENCLYLKEGKCRICESVCKNRAIDFSQKKERIEYKVGAVILALGYQPFDPKRLYHDFGYSKMQNVVTALEYERILHAGGPYEGEIRRPSDGRHPKKIAWIQCVGSRQVQGGGNSYCSAVCCTYTQKQVILTKEHDPEAECVVFHNDIRSWGKDFERYFERAKNLPKVRFIRSYVNVERETREKKVIIRYSLDGEVREEEFDMVVLSIGLTPPAGFEELAKKIRIELESHGFCKVDPTDPIKTIRPGIFVSGALQGPKDIPESVFTASGAVALCDEILSFRRGKLAKPREYPEERDVSKEELRIGVFVCHCGANIGRVVDVPSVVEYSLSLPNVVYADEAYWACSTDATKRIADVIKERKLNRVIVAACTPRTHEPLFRDTLRVGGINPYLLDMANIREHCSWVHAKEKEEATKKAKDLVRMAVVRASFLEPLQEFEIPINKTVLVVGGGIAGMTSALSLAKQGFEVYLVEKERELGGNARKLYYTLDGVDVQRYLDDLVEKVFKNPLIHVYTNSKILDSTGYVGNFVTRIESDGKVKEIKHGATIIAIGAQEYKPKEYLYGIDDRVMTQLELEEKIVKREEKVINAKTIVMIQCVGSRNKDRNYCSRICCSHAIKNALKLKEINPESDIYILFRDMRTYGFIEDYYREASDKEVRFIRYEPEKKPKVEIVKQNSKSILRVIVEDPILKKELEIDTDILVLSSAIIPASDSEKIAKLFKVPLSPDGFFQEAHVKLRPVDFGAEGVYLCGIAHYPKHISESISQAYGASGRALTLLSHDTVTASGSVCEVDEKRCLGCGACESACAYGAIELYETKRGKKARVITALCKGDGLCNSVCPTGAISLKHFRDEQILKQIHAALKG